MTNVNFIAASFTVRSGSRIHRQEGGRGWGEVWAVGSGGAASTPPPLPPTGETPLYNLQKLQKKPAWDVGVYGAETHARSASRFLRGKSGFTRYSNPPMAVKLSQTKVFGQNQPKT